MNINIKGNFLILWIIPLVIWIILYFFLNFDGLYGQDSYEYFRYSKAIHNFFLTGNNPGDYFWPLYYPVIGAIISLILQNTAMSLMLVSVFSLSISAIYLLKIIQLLFPKYNQLLILYIITFYLFSPYVLRSGMVIMSDMLAVCFIVLTVYNYYKIKFKYSISNFYCIVFFSVLAIMTRYASIIIVLPFVIVATYRFFKQKKVFKHIPLLFLIIGIFVLPHFIVRYSNFDSFLSHEWLQSWSITNLFRQNFTTIDGASNNLYPNIFYGISNAFHPGYFFIGLPLIVITFLKPVFKKVPKLLLISICLYALFLAGIPFQNNRFLQLSFPLVIICFFSAFNYLIKRLPKIWLYVVMSFIFIIQSLLVLRALKPILERNHFEIEMAEILKPYQNQTLYSFDIDIALKGRGLEFDYLNLWEKRYINYEEKGLVLFHPTKFKKQWNNKNPILNWNYLNSNYHLKIILNCPNGWKLYRIQTDIID